MTSLNSGQFEENVYHAFPVLPITAGEWTTRTRVEALVKQLAAGRTWPEIIGWRMYSGELDFSLSIWMDFLPMSTVCYYLPAHLVFASILLPANRSYFVDAVMDALILPPGSQAGVLDELDEELGIESLVSLYAGQRLAVYQALNAGQRRCIADYLALYLAQHPTRFGPRGIELYQQNMAYWRDSSLPVG